MNNDHTKNITYRNIECKKMTEDEINAAATLFSENYGVWSSTCPPNKANMPIRFSPKMIHKNFVKKSDCKVALAYNGEELIGHIFYFRRRGMKTGYITWLLQVVVKKEYRGQHIGNKMMQSIWQLSDSYACGLYTSNPLTIKTLERATMRRVNQSLIEARLDKLKSVATDLFENMTWIDGYKNGYVNTDFPVSHAELKNSIEKAYPDGDFPLDTNLPEGHEWLAFTFRSQTPTVANLDELDEYLDFSEEILNQAYSKMDIENQAWASHTVQEVDFIERQLPIQNGVIYDFGCGAGRHSLEFAKRGWSVCGIDLSKRNIELAQKNIPDQTALNVNYLNKDIRYFRLKQKCSVALCLYDVIGSYPHDVDNLKILNNIHRNLCKNGFLILSVMNMDLTRKRCRKNIVEDITKDVNALLELQGSNTMQKTGDIFLGNKMLIDDKTGIVYRKEQFLSEDSLPVEYVIRDRRYTKRGIISLVKKAGFEIKECRFVQAGRFDVKLHPLHPNAKEILVIAQKSSFLSSLVNRFLPLGETWK